MEDVNFPGIFEPSLDKHQKVKPKRFVDTNPFKLGKMPIYIHENNAGKSIDIGKRKKIEK